MSIVIFIGGGLMDIDISLIFGDAARWIMPVLALLVAAFCVPSLLKGDRKSVV